MAQEIWHAVHRELGIEPIVSGYVKGANPMFIERYVYQIQESSLSAYEVTALLTQFGASPVSEGDQGRERGRYLATQSLLIPPGTPTRWRYSGVADFAALYFLPGGTPLMENLLTLAASLTEPMRFSDPLVGAAARELVNEVQRGPAANAAYQENLTAVILEQTLRKFTTPGTVVGNPSHVHYTQVQALISHIRNNLTADLSAPVLAQRAGLSLTHFRRIFLDVVGMPLHTFILTARLDQARTFLSITTMPLSRIAHECGFSTQSHLAACFGKVYGHSPILFRKQLRSAPTGSGAHPIGAQGLP